MKTKIIRVLFLILFVLFTGNSFAQLIKTKKKPKQNFPEEYYQWQSLTAGINYALWNNGNHQGLRYQVQYQESVNNWLSGSISAWYSKGIDKNVYIKNTPQGVIKRDSHAWAYGIEPAVGLSLFKRQKHDLTFFGGVVAGIYKTEEYRDEIDYTVVPPGVKPIQIAKPGAFFGANLRLMYQVRIKKFQISANLVGFNLDGGPYHTYYGIQIGYLLNKPLLNLKKLVK
jgi:hypothetical protein